MNTFFYRKKRVNKMYRSGGMHNMSLKQNVKKGLSSLTQWKNRKRKSATRTVKCAFTDEATKPNHRSEFKCELNEIQKKKNIISERVNTKQRYYSNNMYEAVAMRWIKNETKKKTKNSIDFFLLLLHSASKLRIIVCVILLFSCGLFGRPREKRPCCCRYFYGFRFCVF